MRWRLAEKVGRPLAAIHAPVAGYTDTLAFPVDRFVALLKPEKPVWRLNWGVTDDSARFQPVAPTQSPLVMEATAGERLWRRVEPQTLRRLPTSGAVVFTIRTHITRLDAAMPPGKSAAILAAAVRDMPDATRDYKQITSIAPALLAWRDRRVEAVAG